MQKEYNISFSINREYLLFMCVTLYSLLKNNKEYYFTRDKYNGKAYLELDITYYPYNKYNISNNIFSGMAYDELLNKIIKILKKKESEPHAISIVDEFLEHARVLIFHNGGNPNVFISSADWMIRNLDHRLEVACPVNNIHLKNELLHLLQAQLKDNVKARVLNSQFHNNYVPSHGKKRFRSQQEIYRILSKK